MPNLGGRWRVCDRFIPNRSAMDWDLCRSQLTSTEAAAGTGGSSRWGVYRDIIDNYHRKRILKFNNLNRFRFQEEADWNDQCRSMKMIKAFSADRVLDAQGLIDDYHLNLLDWGRADLLAVALSDIVYVQGSNDARSCEINVAANSNDGGPVTVTSVSWAPDGRHIAIGLDNSDVQLWDSACNPPRLLRTLRAGGRSQYRSRVGALSWRGNILTSGGSDGLIIDHDPRLRSSSPVHTYRGHRQEICGLRWSGAHQLASGGSDSLVHIWDSRRTNGWIFQFTDHAPASPVAAGVTVRALAWCPFHYHLLATGGGESIKFWNTGSGTCLGSPLHIGAGSQVLALLWSQSKQELLSSSGGGNQQQPLTLWEYPSLKKVGQLNGHSDRVMYLAQSPDGCSVVSGSGGNDETIRLWNDVFPPMPEDAPEAAFANSHHTHISCRSCFHGSVIS